MATYDPRQTFKAQQEAFGRASGVTQQQEAKNAKTSFASGSTYDEVPQVLTKGLGSRSDKPKKEEKSLDRKIYEYFMDAGAKVDEPEQNVFALPVYERSMFKIPAVTEVTTQGIKDPFDQFSADTYQFGGYDDTREAAPQVTQTQDPDMQDPRKGLMSAPTMDQPSTPEALTGIPRGLALGNATPSKSYLIKDGDTLSQIAKDNNTTVKAILDLNSEIEDKNVIDADDTIQLPLSDTQAALRRGFDKDKKEEGVEVASAYPLANALNPLVPSINLKDSIITRLKTEEGIDYVAEKKFGEEFYTIGHGHYGADVKEGDTITKKEAEELLRKDVEKRLPVIRSAITNFDTLSKDLQVEIAQSWFRGGIAGSPKTIALINEGKFKEASEEFLDNNEYRTTKLGGVKRRMKGLAKTLKKEVDK